MEKVCIVCSDVGLTAEEAQDALVNMGYTRSTDEATLEQADVVYGEMNGCITFLSSALHNCGDMSSVYRQLSRSEIDSFETPPSKVKSDGGSSSYYLFPQALVDHIIATGKFEVEDLIKYGFDNDYDFGNIVKATKRLYELKVGGGKEGSTAEYEANKIRYYVDRVLEGMK